MLSPFRNFLTPASSAGSFLLHDTVNHPSPQAEAVTSYWEEKAWCSAIPVVCVVVCLSLRIVGQSMGLGKRVSQE